MEEEYTMRGRVMGDFWRQIADIRVACCSAPVTLSGVESDTYIGCAVPVTEFATEVKNAILATKTKDGAAHQIGVLYRYEPRANGETLEHGYYLGFCSAQNSDIDVCQLLQSLVGAENARGTKHDVSGWAPNKKVYEILPFLAP